jgi:5-methylcytosine-specific restriction endonuclease McrA
LTVSRAYKESEKVLPIIFIFVVIVFAYPPILIPVILILILYFFVTAHFDKKHKIAKKKIYDSKWSPSIVFERRMRYAIQFEGRSWERNVDVVIAAKHIFNGAYCGLIKTSTGLELWRCAHGHKSKARRQRGRRSRLTIDPSVEMARRCAEKQLSANYLYYSNQASKQRGGVRHRRQALKNSSYEPIYDTLKSFKFQCAYCGKLNLTKETTHQDHVVPLNVGGANSSENMLPVCSECNLSKGTKSVFQFLIEIESRKGPLPIWIQESSTWRAFRYKE